MVSILFVSGLISHAPKTLGNSGVWGGPAGDQAGEQSILTGVSAAVVESPSIAFPDKDPELADDSLVEDPVFASGLLPADSSGWTKTNNNVLIYIVKKGDTLSTIAQGFGLTQQQVINSNPDLSPKKLRLGQEIAIYSSLPVATDGDVKLASAAANKEPEGNPAGSLSGKDYFVKPAAGFNWGKLHNHNAVDIANSCGTPIIASAEGLVTEVSTDGWNGGYGSYVLIEHPNGTKTRYAHMQSILVAQGDYVAQSSVIGAMGETGEATGCHVHFEVIGADNPFVK